MLAGLFPAFPAFLTGPRTRVLAIIVALILPLPPGLSAQEEAAAFYALDRIVDVELKMHDPYWKRKLNAWKKQYDESRVLATLTIDGVRYDSVGVRLKGNSSYFAPAREDKKKLPFNIKVNYTAKDQRVAGRFKTLKLSNVFRDPSFLREALSYQIARDYLAAPQCNFARLTVDGDYFGLYNLTESVDRAFWADHFATGEEGIMFKCDPENKDPAPDSCPPGRGANLAYLGQDTACYAARYELKKADYGWAELIELTQAVTDEKRDLNRVFNVDEALWMLAFDNALSNLDSYLGAFCHNYYLIKDRTGVWRPVVWDLNLSLGGFRALDPGQLLDDEQLLRLSPFVHFVERNERRPLILRLFDRPLYRKMYVAHLRTIYAEQFASGRYQERAAAIRETITPDVVREPNPLYPTETYTQNLHQTVDIKGGAVLGVEEFFEKRGAYLAAHPLFKSPVPEITDHAAVRNGEEVTISLTLAAASDQPVWVAHRAAGAGTFAYAEARPEADGGYAVVLPAAHTEEYFLVAEGRAAATVLPARSAREWFVVGE